jgi:hypothetical protein
VLASIPLVLGLHAQSLSNSTEKALRTTPTTEIDVHTASAEGCLDEHRSGHRGGLDGRRCATDSSHGTYRPYAPLSPPG